MQTSLGTQLGSAALPAVACLALLAAVVVGPSRSQAEEAAGPVERGRRLYRVYCASCHGEAGRGDGAMREALRVPPADLTGLGRRAGGVFSAVAVERRIDGSDQMQSHGSREMPVWGPTFQVQQQGQPDADEVGQRIRDLVSYLRTIQER